MTESVKINLSEVVLLGDLTSPPVAKGLVVFVHGSGSSRQSPRNRFVARRINTERVGTLLMDLLTEDEESADAVTGELRFDIGLLSGRVIETVRWIRRQKDLSKLPVGLFGSSTGAAAALVAAAELGVEQIRSVVSRGGRPDLAGPWLERVRCPSLLIVGGDDDVVIGLNEAARRQMPGAVEMKIVPGATHLFEEPGTLEQVADLAAEWFQRTLEEKSVGQ